MTEADNELKVGDRIGDRYEILAIVGHGRMGTVYKCRHEVLGRVVAIKTLQLQRINDDRSRRRFEREARLASRMEHQNLISVSDFGYTSDGSPYLVMDFVDGEQLYDILQREVCILPERAINLFIQVCDGLYHAHQRGVIHRDLKPANILVVKSADGSETVKVVDLGVAKIVLGEEETDEITKAGEVCGSPVYLSPEQCLYLELDNRTDIYSLGVCLYECLAGQPPLKAASVYDTLKMHVYEMPRPFKTIVPGLEIPKRLEEVVFRCLAKETKDRYETMMQVKHELMRSRKSEFDTVSVNVLPPESLYPERSTSKKDTAEINLSVGQPTAEAVRTSKQPTSEIELPQASKQAGAEMTLPKASRQQTSEMTLPKAEQRANPETAAPAAAPEAGFASTQDLVPLPQAQSPESAVPPPVRARRQGAEPEWAGPGSPEQKSSSGGKKLLLFIGACLAVGLSMGIGYAVFVNKSTPTTPELAHPKTGTSKNLASSQTLKKPPAKPGTETSKSSASGAKKVISKALSSASSKHNPNRAGSSSAHVPTGHVPTGHVVPTTHRTGLTTHHGGGVKIIRHPDGRVDVYDTDSGPSPQGGSSGGYSESSGGSGDVSVQRHADGTVDVIDTSPTTRRH